MSSSLAVWEGSLSPASAFEDVAKDMLALESQTRGVNQRFVELARRMETYRPADDSDGRDQAVWSSPPLTDARRQVGAVWVIGVLEDERVRAVHFVVESATATGLTVLDDQLGMAFLPDGRILPAHKAQLWQGLTRELAAPQALRCARQTRAA